MNLENPDSEMCLHVALRAVDKFFNQYNQYPGWCDNQIEEDFGRLKVNINSRFRPLLGVYWVYRGL